MTPEQRKALDAAIDRAYPDFRDNDRNYNLSGNDPWTGTITFFVGGYTEIAIVKFTMTGRNGTPQLMIERDWND